VLSCESRRRPRKTLFAWSPARDPPEWHCYPAPRVVWIAQKDELPKMMIRKCQRFEPEASPSVWLRYWLCTPRHRLVRLPPSMPSSPRKFVSNSPCLATFNVNFYLRAESSTDSLHLLESSNLTMDNNVGTGRHRQRVQAKRPIHRSSSVLLQ